MDRWKKNGLKRYWSLTTELLDFLLEKAPDDQELKDMKLFYNNVIQHSDERLHEGLTVWLENMEEPLAKKVKYCKALDRILANEEGSITGGSVYHAICFKDMDALYQSSTSKVLGRMALDEKVLLDGWTPADTECMWKYMHEINRAAYDGLGKVPSRVPTRDEITRNIKSHKRQSDDTHSMSRAFSVAVRSLCESRTKTSDLDDAAVEAFRNGFKALCASDSTVTRRIDSRDASATAALMTNAAVAVVVGSDAPMSNTEWQLLSQVSGLVQVDGAVPSQMMSSIENYAQNLAADVMEGRKDLSSLNFEEMGQEVMATLNKDDVDKLADNVDNLMPMLQTLSRGMGMPPMPMPPT